MPDWITIEEAAKTAGYSISHMRMLVRKGRIAAELKGTMYWVDRASAQAYADEMKRLGGQSHNWRRLRKEPDNTGQ